MPFEGRILVCKIDAVYRRGDRVEIVDWKTGRPPTSEADADLKQFQLALYRFAYATREGIDPATIDAAFYYVAHDLVVRPERGLLGGGAAGGLGRERRAGRARRTLTAGVEHALDPR